MSPGDRAQAASPLLVVEFRALPARQEPRHSLIGAQNTFCPLSPSGKAASSPSAGGGAEVLAGRQMAGQGQGGLAGGGPLSSSRLGPQVALSKPGALRLRHGSSQQSPGPLFREAWRGETRRGHLAPSGLLALPGERRHTTQGSEDSRRA